MRRRSYLRTVQQQKIVLRYEAIRDGAHCKQLTHIGLVAASRWRFPERRVARFPDLMAWPGSPVAANQLNHLWHLRLHGEPRTTPVALQRKRQRLFTCKLLRFLA